MRETAIVLHVCLKKKTGVICGAHGFVIRRVRAAPQGVAWRYGHALLPTQKRDPENNPCHGAFSTAFRILVVTKEWKPRIRVIRSRFLMPQTNNGIGGDLCVRCRRCKRWRNAIGCRCARDCTKCNLCLFIAISGMQLSKRTLLVPQSARKLFSCNSDSKLTKTFLVQNNLMVRG